MFGLISGTIFRDIEVKESKAGKPYARATVKDGFAEDATFVTVYAFDGSAAFEVLRKATKDDPLAAQGRLKIRTYQKGDETKVAVDLMADSILPIKSGKRQEAPQETAPAETAKRPTRELINDDVPF
jgi:Single-strand binding protein family